MSWFRQSERDLKARSPVSWFSLAPRRCPDPTSFAPKLCVLIVILYMFNKISESSVLGLIKRAGLVQNEPAISDVTVVGFDALIDDCQNEIVSHLLMVERLML